MIGNPETYGELLEAATKLIGSKFEAEQLFTHVTQKRIYHMSFLSKKPVPGGQVDLLLRMCGRRIAGEPLQYLLGEWEFYGLPFKVGKGVLIPRQDTEALVDAALELLRDIPSPSILDLCSGTGCVAIAIANELPGASVTAVEISDIAFEYLTQNIEINNSRVRPVKADLNDYRHPGPVDMLTSNPPYIPKETIATLQREVRLEPRLALNGGSDGLDFYRIIPRLYFDQVISGGWFCFEIGIGQSGQVTKILEESGLTDIFTRDDLTGTTRVICGKKP